MPTCPRACAPQQEKPRQWEAHTPQREGSSSSLQLEKGPCSNKDPAQSTKLINKQICSSVPSAPARSGGGGPTFQEETWQIPRGRVIPWAGSLMLGQRVPENAPPHLPYRCSRPLPGAFYWLKALCFQEGVTLQQCIHWLIRKDPDARKDWGQEKKGTREDEMVGWHHRLDGHGFE